MPIYVPRPKLGLSNCRQEIVDKSFSKLDKNGNGVLDYSEVTAMYDADRLPTVVGGDISSSMAIDSFVRQFEPYAASRGGQITRDEFVTYYIKVSKEIDVGNYANKDDLFFDIVRKPWRLDEDEKPKLEKTRIIPSTMSMPTGIARANHMDLIWPSETGKGVEGCKGAVKTVFPRGALPECLQGYFSLFGELDSTPVKYYPPRPSAMPPYDFVWPTETGEWVGYRGVINSNSNLESIPDDIRCLIKTHLESKQLNVAYMPTEQQLNPNFVKSSDIYGEGIVVECHRLAKLRTDTFSGKAAGTIYLGRTGKFTQTFASPSPSGGLNCGTIKRPLGEK